MQIQNFICEMMQIQNLLKSTKLFQINQQWQPKFGQKL